jgi:hypothetical protein
MAVQQQKYNDWRSSHGLDFGNDQLSPILEAQVWRESRGKHRNEDGTLLASHVGAQGLAQIMPNTGVQPGFGIQPLADDSETEALRFQRDYMQSMLRFFEGDVPKAVAAYNAGAGNVRNATKKAETLGGNWWDHLPMPEETVPYMEEILGNVRSLQMKVNGQEVEVETPDPEQVQQVLDNLDETQLKHVLQDVPGSFAEDLDLTDEEQETVKSVMAQVRGAFQEGMESEEEWIWDPVLEHHVQKFPEQPREGITYRDLHTDANWINASAEMYQFWHHEPAPADMTDEELADWGHQFMHDMEWSILRLGRVSHRFSNLHDLRSKLAINYMMDQFDAIDSTAMGVWRGTKSFFTDPFNILGLGSAGTATAGKLALQQAAKQTLKQAIKQSLQRTGVVVGIEGMLYGGIQNTAYQNLELKLDRREEFSHLELATATAVSAAAGAVGGTAFDLIGAQIAKRMVGNMASGKAATGRLTQAEMDELKLILNPVEFKQLETEQARLAVQNATFNKPQGRSPEDDVNIPTNHHSERKLKKLGLTPATIWEGFRATPRSLSDARAFAQPLAAALRGLSTKNVSSVIEGIRRMPFRNDQFFNMKEATGQAWMSLHFERARLLDQFHNVEVDTKILAQLSQQIQELDELYTPMRLMHEAFGSEAGSLLRAERGLRGQLRRFEVTEIMRQNPQLSKREAEQMFIDQTGRLEVDDAIKTVRQDYRKHIDDALDTLDWDKAKALWQAREAEIQRLNDTLPEYLRDDLGYSEWAKRQTANRSLGAKAKDVSERLNEIFISNVFSSTTVMINLVPSGIKSLVKPGFEALFKNPLERRTWVETFANYSAMTAGTRAALKSAVLAFKYEQSLLTGGHMRLMENHLANIGKRDPRLWDWINNIRSSIPGAMRFFPRLLNATDEALSRITYEGYVAGRAAGEAYAEAVVSGVSARNARKLAQKAAKDALEVRENADLLDRKINILRAKALALGFEGPEVDTYVMKNFGDLKNIRLGDDYSAVQYARDVLYKKEFDQNTTLGKLGHNMEELMQDQPWIKWVTGQLFFRTPIRVVEEGLRYTPGFQFLMPQFRRDLMGLNGDGRYAAAMGQQMLSLAFTGVVMLKYAEGEIEGANISKGVPDYRHKRLRYDSARMEDYNVDLFGTGNHWSYRMFDPIATPFKVMVNTLEFMDHLQIRKAQGEFIDKGLYGEAMGAVAAATLPLAMAISDANLFGGLTTTTKMLAGLENIEGDNNRFYQLMTERMRWLQPNTAHKAERAQNGDFRDPSGSGVEGFKQNVMVGLGAIGARLEEHYELHTPRAYDVFGHTRQLTNKSALFNLFGTATPNDRMGDHSTIQMVVMDELVGLQARTNTFFHSRPEHKATGGLDLRTVRTKDGKWTLYDRWNQLLAEEPVAEVLFDFLMVQGVPEGIPGAPGPRPRQAQQIIKDFRDQAFARLIDEEWEMLEPLMQRSDIGQAEIQAGWKDAGRRTNSPIQRPELPW